MSSLILIPQTRSIVLGWSARLTVVPVALLIRNATGVTVLPRIDSKGSAVSFLT